MTVILVVVGAAYFFPTLIALITRKRNSASIAVLNLFLGWTVIGWVFALIWAVSADPILQVHVARADAKAPDVAPPCDAAAAKPNPIPLSGGPTIVQSMPGKPRLVVAGILGVTLIGLGAGALWITGYRLPTQSQAKPSAPPPTAAMTANSQETDPSPPVAKFPTPGPSPYDYLVDAPRIAPPPVFPDFTGAQSPFRSYRTVIRAAVSHGANFAGHMAIAEYGCGTDCGAAYLADVSTGQVYEPPELKFNEDLGPGKVTWDRVWNYRADSSLLEARWNSEQGGFREEGDKGPPPRCVRAFYFWSDADKAFHQIGVNESVPGRCPDPGGEGQQ